MDYRDDLAKPLISEPSEHDHSPTSTLLPSEETHCKHNRGPRLSRFSYLIAATLVALLLIWMSILTWYQFHSKNASPFALIERGNCGHSVEEARAKKCVFDIMLSSWVPPACYDKELSDSIIAANNFTYWTSNAGGQEVSEEEVRKGEFDILYTHGNYHTEHCLYLWKLQMKAQKSSVRVLNHLSRSQMHIAHCHKVLSIDLSEHHVKQLQSKGGTPINGVKTYITCWEG